MTNLNDLFNEQEARLEADAAARRASGQDAQERAALLARAEAEYARLVAHGCIEQQTEDFEDEEEEE